MGSVLYWCDLDDGSCLGDTGVGCAVVLVVLDDRVLSRVVVVSGGRQYLVALRAGRTRSIKQQPS